ncbi:hypothetical protein QBC37DRAFT_167423 [Rhypophila decipiens]|uniref:Transmembrane protein n=1 Tax=Rhypophila decipiens TaxID=261697 RepID=A0AAN6YH64_9PEZI|nr:hypothetical protein QBC37DRAFT_167423 [Rhypophila decipiens]
MYDIVVSLSWLLLSVASVGSMVRVLLHCSRLWDGAIAPSEFRIGGGVSCWSLRRLVIIRAKYLYSTKEKQLARWICVFFFVLFYVCCSFIRYLFLFSLLFGWSWISYLSWLGLGRRRRYFGVRDRNSLMRHHSTQKTFLLKELAMSLRFMNPV